MKEIKTNIHLAYLRRSLENKALNPLIAACYRESIAALEKQIPKEPIKHTKLPNGRFTYLCPTCNRLYWDKEFLSDCCCSCGQKLD